MLSVLYAFCASMGLLVGGFGIFGIFGIAVSTERLPPLTVFSIAAMFSLGVASVVGLVQSWPG